MNILLKYHYFCDAMQLNRPTYALVGQKLGHSFSKRYFTEKFERDGIDAQYINYEIPDISLIVDIVKCNHDLLGFNVTIPYKTAIIPYLDCIDETAKRIGAVNTVQISRTGHGIYTKGYNTDIVGFTDSIVPLLESYHTKALILGTGGASKAVVEALHGLGIETTLVSRRPTQPTIGYDNITPDIMSTHTVIVNATPLGTWPDVDTHPPIPYQYITNRHLCYDLVYNPPLTRFLQLAAEHGAKTINGLAMLHSQADVAWQIWNKQNPT